MSDISNFPSSAKYRSVTEFQCRRIGSERFWDDLRRPARWGVIPHRANLSANQHHGDFRLVTWEPKTERWKAACTLQAAQGYHDRTVLTGRDGSGVDWLVFPCNRRRARPSDWVLARRAPATPSRLPDGHLEGATSGSRIERLMASALVFLDINFDVHSDMPGHPDFILRRRKLAIFTHGCRFHAHGCDLARKYGRQPTSDEVDRIDRNDRHAAADLVRMGWSVLTVWECTLCGPDALDQVTFLDRLRRQLERPRHEMTISGEPAGAGGPRRRDR